ncbi:hypothetical protein QVD17_09856 [Tagetes erecta]|uniref:Uncharacterized protein n=1 Tax=Tagetes erecta TaxID=13708 RepID=A0AAD8L4M6_TARER|nr:hypothetical protein QVD17_09856 [Tagetes erecta]
MVLIRFAVVFVSFALQSLSVHGTHLHHQQPVAAERRLFEGKSITDTQENDHESLKKASDVHFEPVQMQEYYVGEISLWMGSGSNHEMRVGGRKMGDAQKLNVEEAGKNAFKGPQDFSNNQGHEDNIEKTTISPSKSSLKQGFSRSSASPLKLFSNEHQGDEWRKLLEESDKKFMQMMRRDYGGMRKPRRKPPINNHEPKN